MMKHKADLNSIKLEDVNLSQNHDGPKRQNVIKKPKVSGGK
jgi:hypothetical protein